MRKDKIKISVVVPVYNRQDCVVRCIDSVLKNKPFELIIVDDGSTDNTLRKIKARIKNENNVRLIIQGNKGVNVARQNGFWACKGSHIVFLDSDNELVPKSLDKVRSSLLGMVNFFHSVNEGGVLISWNNTNKNVLGFTEWINTNKIGGEFLAVYNREVLEHTKMPTSRYPFEELWHNRMIRKEGCVNVFDGYIQKYNNDQKERMSFIKKKDLVGRFNAYLEYYKEFKEYYPPKRIVRIGWRIIKGENIRGEK